MALEFSNTVKQPCACPSPAPALQPRRRAQPACSSCWALALHRPIAGNFQAGDRSWHSMLPGDGQAKCLPPRTLISVAASCTANSQARSSSGGGAMQQAAGPATASAFGAAEALDAHKPAGSNAVTSERQTADMAHHQQLVKQSGAPAMHSSTFDRAQWLLSAADAWRPTAAEFEAECQVAGVLGKGAHTDVYQVKFKGAYVALKVVRPTRSKVSLGPLPELVLFREARALKYCRHSNIVQCRGLVRVPAGVKCFGDPNSHWAMLEELLSAGSLATMVLRQMAAPSIPTYTRTDALNWTLDIARALAHMHSLEPRVVHRDLRLENVLLGSKEADGRRVAKVTDLGRHTLLGQSQDNDVSRSDQQQHQQQQQQRAAPVARISSSAADKLFEQLTTPGQRGTGECVLDAPMQPNAVLRAALPDDATGHVGSYMYMAPEVFRREPYSEKADIFFLAVILYQLLSRSLLLFSDLRTTNATDDRQYAARVSKGYRPKRLNDVSEQLCFVIERCWAQEPKERPDVSWVVQQLELALEAEAKQMAAKGAKNSARAAPSGIRGAYQSRQGSGKQAASSSKSKDVGAVGGNSGGGGCCVVS